MTALYRATTRPPTSPARTPLPWTQLTPERVRDLSRSAGSRSGTAGRTSRHGSRSARAQAPARPRDTDERSIFAMTFDIEGGAPENGESRGGQSPASAQQLAHDSHNSDITTSRQVASWELHLWRDRGPWNAWASMPCQRRLKIDPVSPCHSHDIRVVRLRGGCRAGLTPPPRRSEQPPPDCRGPVRISFEISVAYWAPSASLSISLWHLARYLSR